MNYRVDLNLLMDGVERTHEGMVEEVVHMATVEKNFYTLRLADQVPGCDTGPSFTTRFSLHLLTTTRPWGPRLQVQSPSLTTRVPLFTCLPLRAGRAAAE